MQGVTKVYDTGKVRVEALRSIDLVVNVGEFVAVVGPSGSGKSTLMNLVGCLDTPTAGTYLLRGREVAGLDRNALARIRNERVTDLLGRVGLGDRMEHRPTELSDGQMQRVAVARALAMNPDIPLADEPTGNLDTTSGGDVMSLMEDLWKQGRTLIVITHDQALARRAGRTVEIRDGSIVRDSAA